MIGHKSFKQISNENEFQKIMKRLTERKVKKQKRDIESVTFLSARPLLGRGDLRGTLSHQSNTLRRVRAHLSYKLGILNILWWEKGWWRMRGIR
jgi:hypothetical protein